MFEILERFTEVVSNEPHLKPILPTKPLFVCLQSGYNLHFLEISTGQCHVYKDCRERTDLWIKGEEEALRSVILGSEKLRKLESRNDIKVTGCLKDILMLEALFFLCEKRLSA
jgi:hypothetical protein